MPTPDLFPNEASPWRSDHHFASAWNFEDESRLGSSPPPQVLVHDVTLRDGEQQAGVVFTADDKVEIAEGLAAAGVGRIEASVPAVSASDDEAVRRIVAAGLPARIAAFSRCMVEDVKRAVDTGVTEIVMEIPSSQHLVELGYRWEYERAIELSIESTRYAHEQGLRVSFFPIDSTRAEISSFLELIDRVAREGHMDALVLVDTFGVLTPAAAAFLTRKVRERLDVPFETHFHMDFSLGVANTLVAVAEGAQCVHVSVSGLGERAGNTPLAETVLALELLAQIRTGVDLSRLSALSALVLDRSGVSIPTNRAVVGERLFNVESGIIASWVKNVGSEHLLETFPYRPELVGRTEPEIVLGKGSGLDSVLIWLDRLDLGPASEAEAQEILHRVKQLSLERKALLDEDDLHRIVDDVLASPVVGSLAGEAG